MIILLLLFILPALTVGVLGFLSVYLIRRGKTWWVERNMDFSQWYRDDRIRLSSADILTKGYANYYTSAYYLAVKPSKKMVVVKHDNGIIEVPYYSIVRNKSLNERMEKKKEEELISYVNHFNDDERENMLYDSDNHAISGDIKLEYRHHRHPDLPEYNTSLDPPLKIEPDAGGVAMSENIDKSYFHNSCQIYKDSYGQKCVNYWRMKSHEKTSKGICYISQRIKLILKTGTIKVLYERYGVNEFESNVVIIQPTFKVRDEETDIEYTIDVARNKIIKKDIPTIRVEPLFINEGSTKPVRPKVRTSPEPTII